MRINNFFKLLLLVAILVFSLACTSFAEAPTVYTENFEGTFDTVRGLFTDSGIFNSGQDNGTYFESSDGYNGGTSALLVTANGSNAASYVGTYAIKNLGFGEEKDFYINMKIKLTNDPVDGIRYLRSDMSSGSYINWELYGEDDGKYHIKQWSDSAASKGSMAPGRWYDMTMKVDKSYCYTDIYDVETGEHVLDELAQVPSGVGDKPLLIRFYNMQNFGMLIDDAVAYSLEKGNEDAFFIGANIENGEKEVVRNKSIELKFTQPVASENIIVKDNVGNELPEGSYAVKTTGLCSVKIAYKTLLEKNASYVVDLSALNMENIGFTTRNQYILDADILDVSYINGNKTADISFKINESSINKIDCRLMGVLYKDKKMIDAAVVNLNDAVVNTELEAALNFAEEITADAHLSLVFFENGNYIPLSTGIACE